MSKRKAFKNRGAILKKFGNRCVQCKSKKDLHIHHKDLDKSNDADDNAEVLCKSCHARLHGDLASQREHDLTDIRKRDLEIEGMVRAAWVSSGQTMDEIGGQEFNEFFHKWVSVSI